MSWVYFAPSDVSCGNPQKQVCSFCLVNNTKWRFYFLPHLWPRKVNHTLQKSTELRLPECKVLTCCAMSLKLILPWGTKAGQLVPRDDLARHSYFMCFSGAARAQRKLWGENIRELLWAEWKHCQRNQLRRGKELKRFAPCCTEAGYSVSNHGCWADFSVTIFVVAVRPEVHIRTQRTLFLSLFLSFEWQLYLSKLPPLHRYPRSVFFYSS